jgi:hypothetical protein
MDESWKIYCPGKLENASKYPHKITGSQLNDTKNKKRKILMNPLIFIAKDFC